ncbi:hypothetical protein V5799_032037 [Amblyomma americanum]|uniref:Uncharacterized protein n=1 Tax=Amblyomma americanum TaxID=6943 RepID=A0AAQ4DSB7_AMBAM
MDDITGLNEHLYEIRKAFKLAFCSLKEQKQVWEKCMDSARPQLAAIVTLREIQVNCRTAKLSGSELVTKHPDIRQRVVRCVENELFQEKTKLESVVKSLKKSQNIFSGACQQAIKVYEKLSQDLSIEDICYRGEIYPSLADMLEWITCIEQQFSSHIHARELLLEETNFGDDYKVDVFVREWKDDAALMESLNDVLATAKFIIEMT